MTDSAIPDQVASLARAHIGVIAQRSAVWNGTVCDLIVKGPTGNHEVLVTPQIDTFFLTRSNDPHPLVKRLNGEPSRAFIHPGALVNFVAAGDRLVTQVPKGNNGMERLAVSFLPNAFAAVNEEVTIGAGQLRSMVLIDRPLLHEILKALTAELITPGEFGRLYAETLTLALVLDLIRHQDGSAPRMPVKGGLAPWQLRRVQEMLADNIGEDVSLAELARAANLSISHFARAFRRSTGLPPHRYQLTLRVERAKQLLCRAELSLTDIALACGFRDHSHFSRAFRRLVGVSPGVWLRIHRL